MLREYAVDPEVALSSLVSLQRFFSEFGAQHGRVISEIPSSWEREQQAKIRELNLTPVAKRKAFDHIKKLASTSVVGGLAIPGELDVWIEKARYVKRVYGIHAILHRELNSHAGEFDYGNMLEECPDEWVIQHTSSVPRNAQNMAKAIEQALSIATVALFVDPYFHPTEDRYRAPLIEFINRLCGGRRECKKAYLHTTTQQEKGRIDIIQGLSNHVQPLLPSGFTLETWIWPQALLHDRFMLTKNVGFAFGHGLDEARYQDAIQVNINRLGEDARAVEFKKFSTQGLRLDDEIVFTGT
ncbi:hypothetical protein [Shewanella algae]|uniref:hypothetical protein n=1 Tax=Shewanella algae TaxID=38313 RepID=UPI001AAF64F1|nr:hypothetical protein [Shewanella algae]MBO2581746.1 hypothetical protein [Shewanella algae]